MPGRPWLKREPVRLRLLAHRLLLDLPVDAERRVREHVVEGLALVEVLDERVALLDRVRAAALDEQVRLAERERGRHELLAVEGDVDLLVDAPQRVLRDQQHAAGAGRRVVDRARVLVGGEGVVVVADEHVDHELDRVARGVEVTRGLALLVEGAVHDVLEDVAHARCSLRLAGRRSSVEKCLTTACRRLASARTFARRLKSNETQMSAMLFEKPSM